MRKLLFALRRIAHSGIRPLIARVFREPNGQKTILLACHNTLTASYLEEIWELLKDDPRLKFKVCFRRPEDSPGDWAGARAHLPIQEVPLWCANLLPWTLVIMANHPGAFLHLAKPWRHHVLRISHGIGGKRIDAEDYYYGSRVRDSHNRFIYTRIFESSRQRQQAAITKDIDLASRIAVVGSRRADKVASAIAARQRAKLTSHTNGWRPSVLIASSWGDGNLFSKHGAELIRVTETLRSEYEFSLRPHPLLLRKDTSGGVDWLKVMQQKARDGYRYSPPTEKLVDAIASADVVVVDDLSSVALFAAVAGVRVIIIPSGSAGVGTDTFLVQLRQIVPVVDKLSELPQALRTILGPWPPEKLKSLLHEINSEPGRSAGLMKQEVYRMLGLQELPAK